MIQPRQVAVYRPVVAPHRPGQLEGDVLRHAGLQLPSEGVLVQVVRIVLDVHLQDDTQRVNLWKKDLQVKSVFKFISLQGWKLTLARSPEAS